MMLMFSEPLLLGEAVFAGADIRRGVSERKIFNDITSQIDNSAQMDDHRMFSKTVRFGSEFQVWNFQISFHRV